MDVDEIDVELLGKDLLDLLGLVLAQQAVVDEDTGHLLADGAGAKGGDHRGVDAAGKGQDDAVLPHLVAKIGGHGLDEVVHRPVLLELADVEEEVREDLLAVLGVLDLGVELRGVDALLGVLHRGDGAYGGPSGDDEALGHVADSVEVAHPHGLLHRRAVEQGALRLALELGRTVLAHLGVENLAAEGNGRDLVAIAEAEHRHAELVDAGIDARRLGIVDGGGTTREDEGRRLHGRELVSGDIARDNLRVNIEVTHTACDQLPVLGAEVENSDELLRLSLGHSSSGLLRKADGSNRCAKASNYDMIR